MTLIQLTKIAEDLETISNALNSIGRTLTTVSETHPSEAEELMTLTSGITLSTSALLKVCNEKAKEWI